MSIKDIGHILWTIETDLTPGGAGGLTGTGGWGQGGRLGTEKTANHTDALALVRTLRAETNAKVWMSPADDRGVRQDAEAGLALVKAARRVVMEAIHAGLESGMTISEIADQSGYTRQTVYNKIESADLVALVKGN